jgi:hypothetical protein
MRGKFNNFTIISVDTPTKERDELIMDSFDDKLNQIYQRTPILIEKLYWVILKPE